MSWCVMQCYVDVGGRGRSSCREPAGGHPSDARAESATSSQELISDLDPGALNLRGQVALGIRTPTGLLRVRSFASWAGSRETGPSALATNLVHRHLARRRHVARDSAGVQCSVGKCHSQLVAGATEGWREAKMYTSLAMGNRHNGLIGLRAVRKNVHAGLRSFPMAHSFLEISGDVRNNKTSFL